MKIITDFFLLKISVILFRGFLNDFVAVITQQIKPIIAHENTCPRRVFIVGARSILNSNKQKEKPLNSLF
jgi:hypothetical protein